jgi:hypothetical protein
VLDPAPGRIGAPLPQHWEILPDGSDGIQVVIAMPIDGMDAPRLTAFTAV